jgi:virulence-associated protein VagC
MGTTAKLFKNGRSQAVRLPREFRFEGDRVRVRRAGRGVLVEPVFTDVAATRSDSKRSSRAHSSGRCSTKTTHASPELFVLTSKPSESQSARMMFCWLVKRDDEARHS